MNNEMHSIVDTEMVPFYKSFVDELRGKKSKVQFLLEEFPESRNNDNYLIMLYWKLVDQIETLEEVPMATKPEVIRRCRQKFNQGGFFLPTDERVLKQRRLLAKGVQREITFS